MDGMCSLAIVRNPYSRMVSIYGYNRFGESESFPTFVKRWKKLMKPYLEHGEKEEWYTPCHLLPMFEYTHHEGKQLVQSIVKQEELKLLKTREGVKDAIKADSSVSDLPDLVRDALLGMPHTVSIISVGLNLFYLSHSDVISKYIMWGISTLYSTQQHDRMPGRRPKSGMTCTTRKQCT